MRVINTYKTIRVLLTAYFYFIHLVRLTFFTFDAIMFVTVPDNRGYVLARLFYRLISVSFWRII